MTKFPDTYPPKVGNLDCLLAFSSTYLTSGSLFALVSQYCKVGTMSQIHANYRIESYLLEHPRLHSGISVHQHLFNLFNAAIVNTNNPCQSRRSRD